MSPLPPLFSHRESPQVVGSIGVLQVRKKNTSYTNVNLNCAGLHTKSSVSNISMTIYSPKATWNEGLICDFIVFS